MTTHLIAPELLGRPVRVLVVGCGGTGSAVAGGLPYLHQAMVARGHPGGLAVTLQDGDTISPANCVRQPFSRGEVGHHKATVLATRMNLFWGFAWEAIPHNLTGGGADADLVIGCVDSRAARATIQRACTRANSPVRYWLDLGNLADRGQFLLGQPATKLNAGPGRLPTAAELWPELVDEKAPAIDLPSCSAAEAITRQEPFTNQVLANLALSLLARLFVGGIDHHGAWVNLATGRVAPIPVPAPQEVPAPSVAPGSSSKTRKRPRAAAVA